MPQQSHDAEYNRDQDQKSGSPQRSASEPKGAQGSSQSAKTFTDPASGEHRRHGHAPNQAESDQSEGGGGTAGRGGQRKP